MNTPGQVSERSIILAPRGRDGQIALRILGEAGFPAFVVNDLEHLVRELAAGAGVVIIADEALRAGDLNPFLELLSIQPAWSDLPIVLLTHHAQVDHVPPARMGNLLGNVTFLERPFHPTTLVSLVTTAVRGRRRQYEARARMEDLHESEGRLQNALKAGRLGSWQLEAQGLRLTCSAITKSHYGRDEQSDFSYDDWLAAVYFEDQPRMQSALQRSLDTGVDFIIEYRNVWPDGSLSWVDVRARAIRGKNGLVASMAGVTSDITERKQAESQLRRLNETLEQQVEERTSQLRHKEEILRQSQKMEAVGQLTGGIAHDFNNMLTGIIGSLELIRRRVARGRIEDLDSLIDLGVTSANRAAALTHRLLAFSRRQSLDSKPVEMNQLVDSMDELLQRSVNESIHLQLRLANDLWTAEADPNQLENALLNLVLNARDAMPDGGTLVVETFNQQLDKSFTNAHENLLPGDYVVLSVSDNGCGMPETVINRAFDPFFTTKPIGQGTGLGLSMIYGFSKQSHGHVSISSEVGHGTTVQLFLPRFQGAADETEQSLQSNAICAEDGETVLIVEDDPAVRALVSEVLSELGYLYIEAGEAMSAVPILESGQRIDLLISDVGLPGMNGRQLADIARQLRPELKVLFITGYAEHAAVRGGFLETGMQLITKPFAFDHLTSKVREMIEAREVVRL
ncbi:Sensory box sensor histidine kinase/response regulator [Pseudomonas coronafaciens pv. garcae]|uniref:histidine kinase n=3 Tax=Pseudomonas syringae group TaxID=136849 RepID=A0AB37QVL4_9PSED|nr:hybrid sensor histidine kinase/response regulator [Pseudomonas coronafaciens]KPZ25280.1 Sensory box histidine kinase/response regulator [Pseudomonas coronafaciens pv. zizaniae]RMM84693.1 Sensory box sensor histidine kinase/response regulator [Pseudomonas coronafaciens pv. striafaciens]RMS02594.1 Sensory box sensor histidine kinase/response regulator [Pseudomonas coronafaciens pv. garcae]RMS05987.1 Sensory box sensor histidine kinase/response regulator [Pseudomonas coronafaciens pv. garcae]R